MTFETKLRSFVGRIKTTDFTQTELIHISNELLREYNEERNVIIEGWRGKSSFVFKEVGDNIIVTKYQKPEKGAEAKEIKTTISLTELRRIKEEILFLFRRNGNSFFIKSKTIAELVYGETWDKIFNNRKRHNKFTIILNVLDKKGFIEYRGGRVRLIENG